MRQGFRPRRLLTGVAIGFIVSMLVLVLTGDGGARVLLYACPVIAVAATAMWIWSVLYLRTDRGKDAANEYLIRREQRRRSDHRP